MRAAQGESLCSGTEVWVCENAYKFTGPCNGDHMGFSVSATGDWSGGGTNDVLIGATYFWESTSYEHPEPGFASLFFMENLATCDELADLRLCGSTVVVEHIEGGLSVDYTKADCFGWDAVFLGDIDNPPDGKADFAVSAPRAPFFHDPTDPGTPTYPLSDYTENGQVSFFISSMFSAGTGCLVTTPCEPPTGGTSTCYSARLSANLIVEGVTSGQRLGFAIERCGDYVALGAPGGFKSLPGYQGKVYRIPISEILSASANTNCTSGAPLRQVTSFTGLIETTGTSAKDRFGSALACAGDLDGSTTPDLIVGAPQHQTLEDGSPPPLPDGPATGPGYVSIIFGPGGCTSAATFSGHRFFDTFGFSVSSGSDLDGDGKNEILVGAPLWDVYDASGTTLLQKDVGSAYVLEIQSCGQPLAQLVKTDGVQTEEFYGWEVCGLGAFGDTATDHWYGVSSRRWSTYSQQGACQATCAGDTTHPGGRLCGKTDLLRQLQTTPCISIKGERERDSVGWSISRIGAIPGLGGSRHELFLATPRWGPDSLLLNERGRAWLIPR